MTSKFSKKPKFRGDSVGTTPVGGQIKNFFVLGGQIKNFFRPRGQIKDFHRPRGCKSHFGLAASPNGDG